MHTPTCLNKYVCMYVAPLQDLYFQTAVRVCLRILA